MAVPLSPLFLPPARVRSYMRHRLGAHTGTNSAQRMKLNIMLLISLLLATSVRAACARPCPTPL
jgi:hypothetical protein